MGVISLAIVLHIVSVAMLTQCQDVTYTNVCFSGSEESELNLVCDDSERINVQDSYYYRNEWNSCFYKKGDCKEAEEKVFSLCNNRQTCNLKIKRIYSLTCGYVTFLRVVYECNKVEPVETVVSVVASKPDAVQEELTENSDYVESPTDPDQLLSAYEDYYQPDKKTMSTKDKKLIVYTIASAAAVVTILSIVVIIVLAIKNCQQNNSQEEPNSVLSWKTINCLKLWYLKEKMKKFTGEHQHQEPVQVVEEPIRVTPYVVECECDEHLSEPRLVPLEKGLQRLDGDGGYDSTFNNKLNDMLDGMVDKQMYTGAHELNFDSEEDHVVPGGKLVLKNEPESECVVVLTPSDVEEMMVVPEGKFVLENEPESECLVVLKQPDVDDMVVDCCEIADADDNCYRMDIEAIYGEDD